MTHKDILLSLKQKGFRMTNTRTYIVQAFGMTCAPLSAADVHRKLQKKGMVANQTTIYRELQFLTEQGVLRPVLLHDGTQRYELASLHHHHHLVCLSCKKVDEFCIEHELDGVERTIAKKKGFEVERHSLEFYGRCAGCTARAK